MNGTLYGTTVYGGAHGGGTVFSISASGLEKVVYSFTGGSDGSIPYGGLVDVKGALYGTTSQGGGTNCGNGAGCGTVYSISTSGSEKVLYRFAGGTDGQAPQAGLVAANDRLYGTTDFGGAYGGGTVFSVDSAGNEQVLHSFGAGTDGASPLSSLIRVNRTLYGTSANGGAHTYGTIFSITTSGNERVVYSFGTSRHAAGSPAAGLLDVNGTLFGTTEYGGIRGRGTVFALTL